MPVSLTIKTNSSPCFSARNDTRPPAGVNLSALNMRFSTIFSSLSRSASTASSAGSTNVSSLMRLSSATCRAALARPLTNSATSSGSCLTSMRPDSRRTSASKSLMSLSSLMPLACIVSSRLRVSSSNARLKRCISDSSGASSSVSGVRNSWLMLAKKRLLIWSSSRSLRLLSSSAARFLFNS